MLRVAETAMALNEGGPMKEVAKLKEKVLKLEAKNRQLENSILDYERKREIYAEQTAELRETNVELDKVKKELADLVISYDEEKKGRATAEEELKSLQQMMIPAEDEPDCARNLATRAELVGEIQAQRENVFKSAKYGFDNAVAQLQVVNPGLVTEGTGLLRKVENGQIVIPEQYRQMEQEEEDDEEGDDGNEDEQMDVNEEGHGESDH
jgi:myosin heavy subunit